MKTRQQKEEAVRQLADKIKKSKSVVLTDYKGMTMRHLSDLRKALDPLQAEFTVAKNTLLKIAFKQAELIEAPAEVTEGSTAVLFAYDDQITPLKALVKALKDASIGQLKGGFLDNEFLDATSLTKLSALPGKDELRAKVVGSLASPLIGMVGVLQGNLRNLVYAVDQIRIKKSSFARPGELWKDKGGE